MTMSANQSSTSYTPAVPAGYDVHTLTRNGADVRVGATYLRVGMPPYTVVNVIRERRGHLILMQSNAGHWVSLRTRHGVNGWFTR